MKMKFLLMAACSLLTLGAFSSCADFTKDDARQLGAALARDALTLAKDAASGKQVDFKLIAAQEGLKLANLALQLATEKAAADPVASPASIALKAEQLVAEAKANAMTQLSQSGSPPDVIDAAKSAADATTDAATKIL